MGRGGVSRFEHVITSTLEYIPGKVSDCFRIFHKQDRFSTIRNRGRCSRLLILVSLFNYRREVNFKRGAFIRLAVNPNMSSQLLYDPIDRRQAEACSFARFFGCEERFEYVLSHLFTYADSGI